MVYKFDTPLRYLKGIGPKKAEAFAKLGVNTAGGLLYYFPFRYEDRRSLKNIKDLKEGEASLAKGNVLARKIKKMPYFLRAKTSVRHIFEVILGDNTGKINCVWFNQHWLVDKIQPNSELIIYGKPVKKGDALQFISPEYEIAEPQKDSPLDLGRIVPVYHSTPLLGRKFVRKVIYSAISSLKAELKDPIPFDIRRDKNIPNIAKSVQDMHFPVSWEDAEAARERFIFEELFLSQALVYLRKARRNMQAAPVLKADDEFINKIKNNLPFTLTEAQKGVLEQILSDLTRGFPMHRLLQGDVGCGKTVLAAFILGIAADNKTQAAFMAPTEVLAYQHKETLDNIFSGLGLRVEIMVSSLAKKKAEEIRRDLKEGLIDIIVGTHALIQEGVEFKNLAAVVIDEQHKFGVAQRALLPRKGKTSAHCFVMSATPIPRSLALSIYGDLDLSVIKELPKNRLAPETISVKEDRRQWVYEFLREKLECGRQAYIVYPLIEESAEEEELKSVEAMYKKISKEFKGFCAAKFYGPMKAEDKIGVMNDFRDKKISILVCTTVVEVGINVENAAVMIVENPEKFGLAQLHQLRGRIQRSKHKPYFIMISGAGLSQEAQKRIEVITGTNDGFKIAEEDLLLRGPGDFFGSSQHGLPELCLANPLRDMEVLQEARVFAYDVIKNDPQLQKTQNRCIRDKIDFKLLEEYNAAPGLEEQDEKL